MEHSNELHGTHTPFWGPVSSNVDWCEYNYYHAGYIAEFYNTISSTPIIFLGILGFIANRTFALRYRYFIAYIFLTLTGIGSTMFHMTLLYSYQLLDELPMILGTLVFLYIATNLQSSFHRDHNVWKDRILLFGLIVYGLLTTILMSLFIQSPLPMNLSYILMVVILLFQSVAIYVRYPDSTLRSILLSCGACYIFGALCWIIEKSFCGQFAVTFYLHAIWHVAAGTGCYLYIVWTSYVDCYLQQLHPVVVYSYLIPTLSLKSHI